MHHFAPQSYTTRLEFKNNGCTTRVTLEVVHDLEEFPEAVSESDPPQAGTTMADAILQMQEGQMFRRAGWKPKSRIGLANNHGGWFYRQDGKRYIPTADDILADDWEVTQHTTDS